MRKVMQSDINVGDKATVASAPASIYHMFDGEKVTILGISTDTKGGEKVFTFQHPVFGFGALYRHGFKRKHKGE